MHRMRFFYCCLLLFFVGRVLFLGKTQNAIATNNGMANATQLNAFQMPLPNKAESKPKQVSKPRIVGARQTFTRRRPVVEWSKFDDIMTSLRNMPVLASWQFV